MFSSERSAGIRTICICILILVMAALLSLLVHYEVIHLWPCSMYELTGIYCLTCGATRAASSLWRLRVLESLRYNPLPVLLILTLVGIICFEMVGFIRKKRVPVEWIPIAVTSNVVLLFIYCIMRNFGILVMPS